MLFETRDSGCKKASVSRTFVLCDSGNRGRRIGLGKSCENALLLRESRAIREQLKTMQRTSYNNLVQDQWFHIRLQTRYTICVSGQKKIGVRCPVTPREAVGSICLIQRPSTMRTTCANKLKLFRIKNPILGCDVGNIGCSGCYPWICKSLVKTGTKKVNSLLPKPRIELL